jgi:hypothetical protein
MSFVSNGGKFKLYTVLNCLIFLTHTQPRISFERAIFTLFYRRVLFSPRSYVAALLCRTLFYRGLFLRRDTGLIKDKALIATDEAQFTVLLTYGEARGHP